MIFFNREDKCTGKLVGLCKIVNNFMLEKKITGEMIPALFRLFKVLHQRLSKMKTEILKPEFCKMQGY